MLQPTISRMENMANTRSLYRMGHEMVRVYCDFFKPKFSSWSLIRVLIGMQENPIFSAQIGPITGRKGSWGERPPGKPGLSDANQPCWPFRRYLMKRCFYNK